MHARAAAWLVLVALLGCRAPAASSDPPQSNQPQASEASEPIPGTIRASLTLVDASGQPLAGLELGIRGSYDARPRALARSDDQGQVQLELDEPGMVFVTLGETSRALVTYGSSVNADTVVLWIDEPTELTLQRGPEGASLVSEGAEAWPVFASNTAIEAMFDALAETARQGEQAALAALVTEQQAAIEAEPNPQLRSLLMIHYVTFAAQAVGPQPALDLLESVPPDDPAWAAQATHLVELLWVLGDEALAARHIAALREHHDDPGLRAALLLHELGQADKRGEPERVMALYRALEDPRFAETIAWRSARRHDPERPISVGKLLPAFEVEGCDEAATPLTQADLLGKAWLIQVWATWCAPCIEELDAMPDLHAQLADVREHVELLSISLDDERDLTLTTLASRSIAWPSTWAPDEEALLAAWGFAGVPLTLLVDGEGRVVEVWDGRVSIDQLEQSVRHLLESVLESGPAADR